MANLPTILTVLALGLALLCAVGPVAAKNVGNVVTDAFFNGIKSQGGGGCEGNNVYSRGAFLNAANSYSGFAHGGSETDGKREIAAFFAHATHETGRKLIEPKPPLICRV